MVMLKGNRSAAVRDACKKHGGFYLASIGGGGNLAEHCIKKVEVQEYASLAWRQFGALKSSISRRSL
jgi:fumarate hydratase class I